MTPDQLKNMIEEYYCYTNKKPERWIMGMYFMDILLYHMRNEYHILDNERLTGELSTLYGIPVTVSKDRYRLELI